MLCGARQFLPSRPRNYFGETLSSLIQGSFLGFSNNSWQSPRALPTFVFYKGISLLGTYLVVKNADIVDNVDNTDSCNFQDIICA